MSSAKWKHDSLPPLVARVDFRPYLEKDSDKAIQTQTNEIAILTD